MTQHDYPRIPIAAPGRRGAGALTWADTGRITIAVFMGALAALIVAAFLVGQYVGHVWEDASTDVWGAGPTEVAPSGGDLTRACRDAIRAETSGTPDVCAGQDMSRVLEYIRQVRP